MQRYLMSISLLFLLPLALHAYEPTWYIGGYGNVEAASNKAELYTGSSATGVFNWRTFHDSGYWALYGALNLTRYLSGSRVLEDSTTLGIEASTRLGPLRVRTESSASLSLEHISYGRYATPSWSLQLLPDETLGQLTPRLEYFGAYTYQERHDEDRMLHGGALELHLDPSIDFGYGLRLSGARELWPEQYLLQSGGTVSDTQRVDMTATAELSAEGLLGYFADWQGTLSVGLRRSNANRYVDSTLEENSESRYTGGWSGSLDWSPVRNLSLKSRLFGEAAWYHDRKLLDSTGSLTALPLSVYRIGATASADVNLSEQLYAVFNISGLRVFSADPGFNHWNVSLKAGLEYSF